MTDTKKKITFQQKMKNLIRARTTMLWIETKEEYRAESKVRKVAQDLKQKVYIWRSSVGLFEAGNVKNADKALSNPLQLAQNLYNFTDGPAVVICEDLTPYLSNPQVARYFKDIGLKSQSAGANEWVTVVVIDSNGAAEGFVPVDLDLPDRKELEKLVDGMLKMVPEKVKEDLAQNGNRDAVIDALTGLESAQAQQALAQSLAERKKVDPEVLMQSKKALISGDGGSGALEWKDPDVGGLDSVGGVKILKKYLARRRRAFTKSRAKTKLPRPKGIVAAGIPGTGKSLCAKAVAAAWQLPLIRFNVGAAFGKYVGESEKGLKKALDVAEAVAPCILWIDEVEKALAGSGGGGDSDGGTTVRVFGELLTWMNECEAPVYVVATCNNPTKIDAEFFRPGRFDKIWWVDVPNAADRREVFDVMVGKYEIDVDLDLDLLVANSKDFTGAEIEHAVVEGLWTADDEDRDVTTDDILEAVGGIRPTIQGWGDRGTLAMVREWADAAAVPACDPPEQEASPDGSARVVDLDFSDDDEGDDDNEDYIPTPGAAN